jgi:tetratricopeptide (TPR) repeat protein
LERSGAAQVFATYARAAQPEFSITSQNARTVYAICAKLEGIPLAIQIAASQMRYLTESEIARGLDDRLGFLRTRQRPELPQHRSVRASLDFSCNLLPDGSARDLLPLLSVFDGSFTAEAAQTICHPSEPDASKFLNDLNALVDLSLVSPEAGDPSAPRRYSMLGLLRDYARELVPDGQGDALQERHFRFFLALAEEQASLLGGSKQAGALEALGAELRNLHAAAQWCMDRPAHAQGGLELAVALSPFWMVRGHYADGSKLVEGLLAAAGLESGTLLRAHALNAAGKLAYALGQYAAAKRHYVASRELYRALDDFKNMANPVSNLGVVLCETGEYREGYRCHNQALELRRRFNPGLVMASLNNLARQHYLDKDLTSADAIWTQALELAARSGDTANIALIKSNLCAIAIESGDLRKARTLLTESLDIRVLIGNPEGIASVLDNCAVIAGTEHQWGRAVALRGASGMLRASTGTTWSSTGLASMQETVRDATAQIGEQEVQTHWERGESMTPAEAVRYARESLASSGEGE